MDGWNSTWCKGAVIWGIICPSKLEHHANLSNGEFDISTVYIVSLNDLNLRVIYFLIFFYEIPFKLLKQIFILQTKG